MTTSAVADTLLVPFNNASLMARAMEAHRGEIAAVILEPIPGNMGLVAPHPGYLNAVRRLCDIHGALLVFDEVISGFRAGPHRRPRPLWRGPGRDVLGQGRGRRAAPGRLRRPGGHHGQNLAGRPRLPSRYPFGQSSGHGGRVGQRRTTGRRPVRPVGQDGRRLEAGVKAALEATKVKAHLKRIGAAFTLFFTDKPVVDFDAAKTSDLEAFATFFQGMLKRGFYLPPAQFEAGFRLCGPHPGRNRRLLPGRAQHPGRHGQKVEANITAPGARRAPRRCGMADGLLWPYDSRPGFARENKNAKK